VACNFIHERWGARHRELIVQIALSIAFRSRGANWMLLRTSAIRSLSDSIVSDGSEAIRCEGSPDFAMLMID
jgi:hypothetical protein